MSSDLKAGDKAEWIQTQKKTFTKWANSHLRKRQAHLDDIEADWVDGIMLMKLINALYDVPVPKHNPAPKMRPQQLDNITLSFKMVEQAGVKTNFLKTHHLADKDLKMILGMVWAIILDFQIKGITVEESSAKEGLLLWCQKKTKGYDGVKVDNFTTSWQDGLALCALIHRHRPDLIDFDSLDKKAVRDNLNLAFNVAEDQLGITKLLDIEDLVDVARPDERAVMTYISEFFHKFSSQDLKETAARRVQKFLQFNQAVDNMKGQYETDAQGLLEWIEATIGRLSDRSFDDNLDNAKAAAEAFREYKHNEKPPKNQEKVDLEALLTNINIKLSSNHRQSYAPPAGKSAGELDASWERLADAERDRSKALRENIFRLKEALRKAFATAADLFVVWITATKESVVRQNNDENLTSQLARLKEHQAALTGGNQIADAAAASKALEEAGIDENPHTDHTLEDLTRLNDQLNSLLSKKINFIENQLLSEDKGGLTPEQLQEFQETFRHFDRDADNHLDKLEFRACLAGLGKSFRDDSSYEEVFVEVSGGEPVITFEKFVDYMVNITQDTDSPLQIKMSFRQLANDQSSITGAEMQVHPLSNNEIDYATTAMSNMQIDNRMDYASYVDSVFQKNN